MTDKEIDLIRRLKTGDESALEEIIKVFNQYVASIVSKILYGYTDGIDIQGIINYVFFQLWQNSDRLDASRGSGLKSYLGTIARNAAINEKRKTYIVNGKLVMKNLAAEATLNPEHEFTAKESGEYYFCLICCSSDSITLKEGNITVK